MCCRTRSAPRLPDTSDESPASQWAPSGSTEKISIPEADTGLPAASTGGEGAKCLSFHHIRPHPSMFPERGSGGRRERRGTRHGHVPLDVGGTSHTWDDGGDVG